MVDLVAQGERFARFWTQRHLCMLSTFRRARAPHVVPVGVTLDVSAGLARVITSGDSVKARLASDSGAAGVPVAVSQVEGRWWSTLEGRATVRDDAASVADAERRYAQRYRVPRPNPRRVVLEITITGVLGNV